MATSKKTSGTTTKVTRIKASDSAKQAVNSEKVSKRTPKKTTAPEKTETSNPLVAFGGYFKGAWTELKQVHWPTRKATWSLTFAVLAFTAFFIVLIVLLDAGFKLLFERILG
ncbi:preprotein translocase subunit SecE [compost metagenome]